MQKILSMVSTWLTPDGPILDLPAMPIVEIGDTRLEEVIDHFGASAMVWRNRDGTVTWEYTPEFANSASVIVTVDADDVIVGYEIAATSERLALVRRGMNGSEVRRLLGRPASTYFHPDSLQTLWRWYPETGLAYGRGVALMVLFDGDGHVIETRCDVE